VGKCSAPQLIKGLYRINEDSLRVLDDRALGNLHRAGTVGLAYAQLLSTANLAALSQKAALRAEMEANGRQSNEIKSRFLLSDDLTIDWDWSKYGI
jgi:hypothetical protein